MYPSSGSNQQPVTPAAPQQGVVFEALKAAESLDADPISTTGALNTQTNQPDFAFLQRQAKKTRARHIRYAVLTMLIVTGLGVALLRHSSHPANLGSATTDASQKFGNTTIPLADLNSVGAISVQNGQTLSINGQLNVNNSLVLNPTTQPAGAVTGQLYYDQAANQLAYFNGKQFVNVLAGNGVVSSVGGIHGDLTTGTGLAVSGNSLVNTGVLTVGGQSGNVSLGNGLTGGNGQLNNTGVLSLQGQAGNVSLTAGGGIAVNGTTISSTGVLALGGQSGTISVGAGLDASGGTLRNTGIISAIGSGTITVTNDGNGNITIDGPNGSGGGGGTVASPGGTSGKIAKFTGVQTIADSLLSESGATVTVAGNLHVTGGLTIDTPLTVSSGGTGATTVASARANLGAAGNGVNSDITSLTGLTSALSVAQGGTGVGTLATNGVLLGNGTSGLTSVVAGAAGLCLTSTIGAPSFQACPGSGGVSSIDGLNGALSLANSSGSGSTITINDATTATKGIASFNAGNFTVSSGSVNTIQNIGTSAAPSFGQLSLVSGQAANTMFTVNNTNAAGTGNLLDLQVAGVSKLSVAPNGNLTTSGTIASGTINGQTISNAAIFTGSVTVGGALSVNTITPTSALTVGVGTQSFTLQGNATSTLKSTAGANTTTVGFQSPTANVTYDFATAAAGSYTICTTVGNCAGVGGSVTTPGGSANSVAKFTASGTIGNSIITDNGTTVGIGGTLAVNTIIPTASLTVGATGQNLTLQGASVSLSSTAAGITNSFVFAGPSGSNKTITLPNASGTVAVNASGPLSLDSFGNLTCPTCLTSGGGGGSSGVSSLNGLTGGLTLQGSDAASFSNVGTTITVHDATSGIKGLASFNATNLTVTAGNVNTIQDIATTSTPTFAGLNLTTALSIANGGTGANTAAGARTALGVAKSGANSDITSLSGLTTALSVLQGGTGAASLTANGVLIGNGTSAVTAITGTTGQCLLAITGAAPSFGTCPGSGGVASVNGQTGALTVQGTTNQVTVSTVGTTLTISTPQDIATTSNVTFNNVNSTTGYKFNTTSGATNTCAGGQFLQNQVVQGGIVTGGTCTSGSAGVGSIGALDGGTANANGATIAANTLFLQSASANFAGLVNTTTQTLAGDKTLSGSTTISSGILLIKAATVDSNNSLIVKQNGGSTVFNVDANNVAVSVGGTLSVVGAATFGGASTFSATNALTLGSTSALGGIKFLDGTADGFAGTLNTTTLTANRTINLPNEAGTICLQNSTNCGFLTGASAAGSYVQLQSTTPGTPQTGNLNISGAAIFGTNLSAAGTILDGATLTFATNSVSTITSAANPSGNGNSLTLKSTSGTTAVAGAINLNAANSAGTGAGGSVNLQGGSTAGGIAAHGGDISITGGATNGSTGGVDRGGNITLTSGASTGAAGSISSGSISIKTGTATSGAAGDITIDNGSGGSNTSIISIGTTNARTVTVGNTSSTTTVNGSAINVGATATTHTLHIADGAAAQTVSVGSTNTTSTLTLQAGSGGVAINGATTVTGALSGTTTINAATGFKFNGTAGATTTCTGGTSLQNTVVQGGIITGGSCGSAPTGVTLQASSPGTPDTGNFNISGVGIATTFQASSFDTVSAGALNIGNSNATTVNLATNNSSHTINIATGTTAQTVTIGSTDLASTLTIQAGSGGITQSVNTSGNFANSIGGTTVFAIDNQGRIVVKPLSDTSTPTFQVKDTAGNSVFNVNTLTDVTYGGYYLQTGAGGLDTSSNVGLKLGTANATDITVGSTTSTNILTLGQSSATNTINIGSNIITAGNTQTINIGTLSTSTGKDVVTIGSTNDGSSTTIQGGTGNITLVTNSASASIIAKSQTNSTTAFQIQTSGAASILTADTTTSTITIAKLVVTGNITINGHLVSGGSAPTIAAGSAACTTPTVNVTGTDTAGLITVTSGSGCSGAAGKLATISFSTAFGAAPRVLLTAGTATAVGITSYVDSSTITTGGFDLATTSTTVANGTTYKWYYHVIQ